MSADTVGVKGILGWASACRRLMRGKISAENGLADPLDILFEAGHVGAGQVMNEFRSNAMRLGAVRTALNGAIDEAGVGRRDVYQELRALFHGGGQNQTDADGGYVDNYRRLRIAWHAIDIPPQAYGHIGGVAFGAPALR